jgi:4-hydroxy-2-oxoheptanedioate aldolase
VKRRIKNTPKSAPTAGEWMAVKHLRRRILNRETLVGCFLNLGSSLTAEIVGQSGFDWVLVDLEHGVGGESELLHQLQSLQHTPAAAVVRVESHERQRFHRVLDLGADGVMAPRVDTAEQARAVAAAIRFPPNGVRGVAKMNRAYGFGAAFKTYVEQIGEHLLGIVQIESETSLQNLDEIAAVDGIDVLFVGPSDLSYSLGIPFDLCHPRFQSALEQVIAVAERHGKATGIKLSNAEDASRCLKLGYRLLACGSDGDFVHDGARSMVSRLRRDL